MKAYTDIEQSKKLAEMLPLESADMTWCFDDIAEEPFIFPYRLNIYEDSKDVPAWSLAVLLEQIPSDLGSETLTIEKDDSEPFKYGLNYHDRWGREDDIQTKYYDNLVDACYEMILMLNEQKIL